MSYINYVLETEYDVTKTYHVDGYCSDPGEIITDYYTEFITDYNPCKDFVSKYCDSDGIVNCDGLEKLNQNEPCEIGSGYCGCRKILTAKRSKLIKQHINIKDEFINDSSSKKKLSDTTHTPVLVNTFRGIINSTYTQNSNWYNSSHSGSKKV